MSNIYTQVETETKAVLLIIEQILQKLSKDIYRQSSTI